MTRIRDHIVIATGGIGLLALTINPFFTPLLSSEDSFVLLAQDRITVGPGLSLSSGDIGVTDAKGKLVVAADTSIDGDIYAETVVLANGVQINGSVTAKKLNGPSVEIFGDTFIRSPTPLVASFPTISFFTPGSQNITIPASSAYTLSEGDWYNLNVGPDATLIFEGGLYTFNKLVIGPRVTIRFLTPTLINADTASFGPKTVFSPEPSLPLEDIRINLRGRTISFGPGSLIFGIITAPDANITLGPKSVFRGQLMGRSVTLGSNILLSRAVSFDKETNPATIVTDPEDGSRYPVNEILVNFTDEATLANAQAVADVVNGTVTSFIPSANAYRIEIESGGIRELDQSIARIQSLNDHTIEDAMRNYILEFIP